MMNDLTGPFVGNRIIAVSVAPGVELPAALLTAEGQCTHWSDGALLICEQPNCYATTGTVAVALITSKLLGAKGASVYSAGSFLDPDTLSEELLAPAVRVRMDGSEIVGVTDRFGLGQLFAYERSGIAAISTSATWLAEVFGADLDREALLAFAKFGAFIGDDTPYAGIKKVPLGHGARLAGGQIQWPETFDPLEYRSGPASTLEEVRDTFQVAVEGMILALPEAELELSGGLDSRLILAAIPPQARIGLKAMTIGPPSSADVRIARQLARQQRLDHRVIDPSAEIAVLTEDQFDHLLQRITLAYDHLVNPIDKVAIVASGLADTIEPKARFGGQNGEILRGFYYPLQPIGGKPSAALVERLITLRLSANDRVSSQILGSVPEESDPSSKIERSMLAFDDRSWGQTLDRLYLTERMPRWAGAATNNRFVDRLPLYPFFHPAFVSAAMRLPNEQKNGPGTAYALLALLDPQLASMPLDSGIVPANSAGTRPAPLSKWYELVKKVWKKVYQRISGKSKPVLGSQAVIDRWYGLNLFKRLPAKRLNEESLLDQNAMRSVGVGSQRLDRASLGFVLLLSSLLGSDRWNSDLSDRR